jgi:hypothetical protein
MLDLANGQFHDRVSKTIRIVDAPEPGFSDMKWIVEDLYATASRFS